MNLLWTSILLFLLGLKIRGKTGQSIGR